MVQQDWSVANMHGNDQATHSVDESVKNLLSGQGRNIPLFKVELPGADEFTSEQVSIPVGWWLTDKDLVRIIGAIVEYDRCYRPRLQEIRDISEKRGKRPVRQANI
jgi:hypothetical protein